MKPILFSLFLFLVAVAAFNTVARANIIVWQDPDDKVSMTLPDTWARGSAIQPDDAAVFYAPADGGRAMCRMRVREDGRFRIYPQRFSDEIQRTRYSYDFWSDYANGYGNAAINQIRDDAGLGRGFASFADISYVAPAGPDLKMQRRAVGFASVYNNKAYILECSAEASFFEKWYFPFMEIAKSVDFRKEVHELPGTHYRQFYADPPVRVNGERDVDVNYFF